MMNRPNSGRQRHRPGVDDISRQLSLAFTTRTIRQLASKSGPWPRDRIAPIVDLAGTGGTLADAFDAAYRHLARGYRCEYVYANSLTTAAAARADDVNVISGLHVCMSISDLVIADQQPAAYEIKTDLDSFARLELQLHSYGTCFEHVHVVTSPAKTARAIADTPVHVGILTLADTGELEVARPAAGGLDRIERSAIFRVLRRAELLSILARQFGYTPDVPNALIYQRLHGLFMQLDVETAHREFVTELAQRDQAKRQAAAAAGLPESLRAAVAGLALTPTAWRRLGALLRRPAADFRSTSIAAAAV